MLVKSSHANATIPTAFMIEGIMQGYKVTIYKGHQLADRLERGLEGYSVAGVNLGTDNLRSTVAVSGGIVFVSNEVWSALANGADIFTPNLSYRGRGYQQVTSIVLADWVLNGVTRQPDIQARSAGLIDWLRHLMKEHGPQAD